MLITNQRLKVPQRFYFAAQPETQPVDSQWLHSSNKCTGDFAAPDGTNEEPHIGGFLKCGYPKSSSMFIGYSMILIINYPFLGYSPVMETHVQSSIFIGFSLLHRTSIHDLLI